MELEQENPYLFSVQQSLFVDTKYVLRAQDDTIQDTDAWHSTKRGAISEMRFIEYAWKHGFEVAENRGSSTWDVAISKPRHNLLRVQVKTFYTVASGASYTLVARGGNNGQSKKLHVRGDYDILACYDRDREAWHFSDFIVHSSLTIHPHRYCGISELHRLYEQLSKPIVINIANSPSNS